MRHNTMKQASREEAAVGEGSRRHAKIFKGCPFCIYCGGTEPATTIDHMPPRVFFRLTQRPKGLEFASCLACNGGSGKADLVAALYGRCFPGISSKAEGDEWDRLTSAVKNNIPGLLEEMLVDPLHQAIGCINNGISNEQAFFFAGGPITFAHMTAFAAKVGFALDFENRKVIVPHSGRVQVRWFTSQEMIDERLPPSLFALTGELKSLRQGKISADEDFQYAHGDYRDGVRIHYLRFRQSFSVAAFVVDSVSDLPFSETELATFAPGELRTIPEEKVIRPYTKADWLQAGMPTHWD